MDKSKSVLKREAVQRGESLEVDKCREEFEKLAINYDGEMPLIEIACDGCEENCIMPVTIYPITETSPARAFITCDKRDDIGRVKVEFERLKDDITF